MRTRIEHVLLTPDEMGRVDGAAAASGLPSFGLMQRAGMAVAADALRHFPETRRFAVLCGPGNNGGDGYVAAQALAAFGCAVAVYHLGDPSRLSGDALTARQACEIPSLPLELYQPVAGDLVIDAVFGAGLSRDVPNAVALAIERVQAIAVPVLAVDLPSGLCGRRGAILGQAFAARRTITFMARKPGHLLMPGRSLCGDVSVFDIGIPQRILEAHAGAITENTPFLWGRDLPTPGADSHKYRRGHLGVFSGPAAKTGAARLSALAGLKTGAGLVTIASPADAMADNAGHLTAVMLRQIDGPAELGEWLDDARLSAFVLGPGFGIGHKARDFVGRLSERALVLDADGMTSFKEDTAQLFDAFSNGEPHLVLTPHEGEFARLFPDIAADRSLSKVEKAQAAARRAHAAIVYKGADTVISAPDGRATINTNAPPWLATAGSGDVLAGMIGALLAQGMPVFEAAAAGVYLHGEAAHLAGAGLTAEDLAEQAGRAMAGISDHLP
ncbi:MAG: NAD(P)H-hydrate dehydratase [Neorhizobium sp.]|nr:NAD(P)H-hydrate dehydratase [Neorhizobium sp.]